MASGNEPGVLGGSAVWLRVNDWNIGAWDTVRSLAETRESLETIEALAHEAAIAEEAWRGRKVAMEALASKMREKGAESE